MDDAPLLPVEESEGLDSGLGLPMLPGLAGRDADNPAGLLLNHDVAVWLQTSDLCLFPSHGDLWNKGGPNIRLVCGGGLVIRQR